LKKDDFLSSRTNLIYFFWGLFKRYSTIRGQILPTLCRYLDPIQFSFWFVVRVLQHQLEEKLFPWKDFVQFQCFLYSWVLEHIFTQFRKFYYMHFKSNGKEHETLFFSYLVMSIQQIGKDIHIPKEMFLFLHLLALFFRSCVVFIVSDADSSHRRRFTKTRCFSFQRKVLIDCLHFSQTLFVIILSFSSHA
jgi:hypothetical protein